MEEERERLSLGININLTLSVKSKSLPDMEDSWNVIVFCNTQVTYINSSTFPMLK